MKTKLCISMVVAGLAALSGSALADGTTTGASTKERPFTWTGFYIGAQGGFGEARSEFAFTRVAPFPVDNVFWPISGGFVGPMIGYNYQMGYTVVGIQAEYNWADINGEQFDAPFDFVHSAKLDNFGSVDARLGIAVGRGLGYLIGGWAWGDPRQRFQVGTGGPAVTFKGADDNGWDAGFGLEYAFPGGWTGRLEYRHYDFGSVSQPTLFGSPFLAHEDRMERFDTGRIGIAYKFGGGDYYAPMK